MNALGKLGWNQFWPRRGELAALSVLAVAFVVGGCKSSSRSQDAPGPAKDPPATRHEFVGGFYQRPAISTQDTAKGTVVALNLRRAAGRQAPGGQVPYTREPYTLTLAPKGGVLQERSLFGTGLQIDLDGNGTLGGAQKVSCGADGSAQVGDTVFETLFRPSEQPLPDLHYGPGKHGPPVKRLGPKGAYVTLLSCRDTKLVSFGISPPDRPLEVERVASPALQLLLAEAATGPDRPMSASLVDLRVNASPVAGAPVHQSWLYGGVLGRSGWEAVRWVLFPVSASARSLAVTVTVRGVKPATPTALLILLNTSHGLHGRRRHLVGFVPLGR